MEACDFGRFEVSINSVPDLERRLPRTVPCKCGELITTHAMLPVDCHVCGTHHKFLSIRS